jgi:N-dimethylarginine dimethylaminohydrolase
VYTELHARFGLEIEPLELIDPDFYHLDTCFVALDAALRTPLVARGAVLTYYT